MADTIIKGKLRQKLSNGNTITMHPETEADLVSTLAWACVATKSTDTVVDPTKTYYTRTASSAGAGYLNDGSYKYTLVASPTGNPSTNNYYEVSNKGSDASTVQAAIEELAAGGGSGGGGAGVSTIKGLSGVVGVTGAGITSVSTNGNNIVITSTETQLSKGTDTTGTSGLTYVSDIAVNNHQITLTKSAVQDGSTSQKGVVQLQDSIDSTTTKAATPNAVKKAIEALDVSNITANLGAGKTITALSETDGKIAATASDISITSSQVSDLSTTLGSYVTKSGDTMTGGLTFNKTSGDTTLTVGNISSTSNGFGLTVNGNNSSGLLLTGGMGNPASPTQHSVWLDGSGNIKVYSSAVSGKTTIDGTDIPKNKTLATTTDLASYVPTSQKGVANGVATLDANTKVPLSQLPDAILGQLIYGGSFDGNGVATISNNLKSKLGITDNSIQLINSATDDKTKSPKEYGYKSLEGVYFIADATFTIASTTFEVGDWLVSNGSSWKKIDNTDAVTGVKGNAESSYRTGNINITPANIGVSATTSSVTVGSTTFNKYSHPAGSGASKTSGFYKFSTDATSHISGTTAVTASDITGLIADTTALTKYLPLTGGTLTGELTINEIIGAAAPPKGKLTVGGNDSAWVITNGGQDGTNSISHNGFSIYDTSQCEFFINDSTSLNQVGFTNNGLSLKNTINGTNINVGSTSITFDVKGTNTGYYKLPTDITSTSSARHTLATEEWVTGQGYKTSSGVTAVTYDTSTHEIKQAVDGGTAAKVVDLDDFASITKTTGSEAVSIGGNTLNVVTRDTTQTISGAKTFTDTISVKSGNSTSTIGYTESSTFTITPSNSIMFIKGNLYPAADDTYSLGSAMIGRWKNLTLSGNLITGEYGSTTSASVANVIDAANNALRANQNITINSGKKSDGSTDITGTASGTAPTLGDSGITAGTYSAIQVNAKGIAVAGGQMLAVVRSGESVPTDLAVNGWYFQENAA